MEIILSKKTYEDFGVAIEELRQKAGISYDTIAFGIRRAQSYVYGICNRRTKTMPKYELVKEFADFFHLEPDYFYEYRLRKHLDFIDKNREFLDHMERQAKKYAKEESEVKKEITETENGDTQEQSA